MEPVMPRGQTIEPGPPFAGVAPPRRRGRLLFDAASAVVLAGWVAICAAGPEFIWRGFRLALGHLSTADLYAALMIGAVLAFFIEPLLERLRGWLHHTPPHGPRNVLFTAAMAFAFALTAVCLHEALTAFVKALPAGAPTEPAEIGLRASIALAMSWAMVPFAVTLAWLGARETWRAAVLVPLAAISPALTGWLFDWTARDTLTTLLPCSVILGLGLPLMRRLPVATALDRAAGMVAAVASVWLVLAATIEALLGAAGIPWRIYEPGEFWIDMRFYLGWTLGLLLVPSPPLHIRHMR